MSHLREGQCGLCVYFGEQHPNDRRLIQIRIQHDGPESLVDECWHPNHRELHLKVTPISGCDGFEPAMRSFPPQPAEHIVTSSNDQRTITLDG